MSKNADHDVHWLDQYASECFSWREHQVNGRTFFYRPLGLVESCFDSDGRYFEGRADISLRLNFTLTSNRLQEQAYRSHVILAWACFRISHILMLAKALEWQNWMHKPDQISDRYCFVIAIPETVQAAKLEAEKLVTFVDTNDNSFDPGNFYQHLQNSSRVLCPDEALARLFVLPQSSQNGQTELTFILVAAHQIGDGVSASSWMPSFVRFLNMTDGAIHALLQQLIQPESISKRLPPAQEALYPSIQGNKARIRWFWLLTRILRHVRKPLVAGFANPLLRDPAVMGALPLNRDFEPYLSYERKPPNSSAPFWAQTSRAGMIRLSRLCQEAKASVGAGCFAFAAVLMMEFYEKREACIPLQQRKPFITGFPLNPRPWLVGRPAPESLMLSFSDGIMLPFLSSSLDFDGRMRLLARQAQRQLAAYQKRSRIEDDHEALQYMSSRGAGRLLAIQYLNSIERCDGFRPAHLRLNLNPQGAYPMRPNMNEQTCGVSSVGKRANLNSETRQNNGDFVIEGVSMQPSVRARGGEFLIGIDGGEDGLRAMVSVDGSSMDPDLVQQWRLRFESILDEKESAVGARL